MSYAKAVANSSSSGIGIFGLMFIVMFTLKLGGVIDLSWWLVTAPLWIPACLVGLVFLATMCWLFYLECKK